jgi:uncharacterized membrane protein YccC
VRTVSRWPLVILGVALFSVLALADHYLLDEGWAWIAALFAAAMVWLAVMARFGEGSPVVRVVATLAWLDLVFVHDNLDDPSLVVGMTVTMAVVAAVVLWLGRRARAGREAAEALTASPVPPQL